MRLRKPSCFRSSGLLLAAFVLVAGLVAQSAAPPPMASIEPQLIANFAADQRALQHYQHREHVVLIKNGRRDARTYRVWYVRGHLVNETIALDDRRLSPSEITSEHARALQRAADAARREDAPSSVLEFNHVQYSFTRLAGDYVFGPASLRQWQGRDTWVYPASPDPAAPSRSREENILLHSTGEIWVDAADLHVVRISIHTTGTVDYLLGVLARVHSANLELVLTRHTPGEWLPASTSFQFQATVLLLDHFSQSKQQTFSDYAAPAPAN